MGQAFADKIQQINQLLDQVTQIIQKCQREAGKTFVSRTRLEPPCYHGETITVFRSVLANPLTTDAILDTVLKEQCELAQRGQIPALIDQLRELAASCRIGKVAS